MVPCGHTLMNSAGEESLTFLTQDCEPKLTGPSPAGVTGHREAIAGCSLPGAGHLQAAGPPR